MTENGKVKAVCDLIKGSTILQVGVSVAVITGIIGLSVYAYTLASQGERVLDDAPQVKVEAKK